MKYSANYNVNNGQHVRPSYQYANKREAVKSIRAIAQGNVYHGNIGTWSVVDDQGQVVAQGKV